MIFYSLLTLVLLSPLPYATNRPSSWSLWALLIGLLAICWSIKELRNATESSFFTHFKAIADIVIIFFLLLLWICFQTAPAITPQLASPLWGMLNATLKLNIAGSISVAPEDGITALMRILSYALVFWLSLCYCQNRNNAKQLIFCLMIFGVLYSSYGLIIQFGGYKTVLWQHKWSHPSSLSSTFINRNHFATYAGLTLLCCIACAQQAIQSSVHYKSRGFLGIQRFLEKLIYQSWLPLLAFFIISSALLLTHSRGGVLSTLFSVIILSIAVKSRQQKYNIGSLLIIGLLLFFASLIFYLSSDALFIRFEQTSFDKLARINVYAQIWAAIQSNPWLGFGLGSFAEAFPLYKQLNIAGSVKYPLIWDYAHNSYLETLFELGIPAALALFYCFLKLIWICIRGLSQRKRDKIYPALGIAATALVGSHALVDFSMQIPAVIYTYFLLMGCACAQSFSSRQQNKQ